MNPHHPPVVAASAARHLRDDMTTLLAQTHPRPDGTSTVIKDPAALRATLELLTDALELTPRVVDNLAQHLLPWRDGNRLALTDDAAKNGAAPTDACGLAFLAVREATPAIGHAVQALRLALTGLDGLQAQLAPATQEDPA